MTRFIEIACCRCKEVFGMCEETYRVVRRTSQNWYCPFGHEQHFTEEPSEADKLRRERDRLKQDIAYKDDRIASLQTSELAAWRTATAFKGVATRIKNRVGRGVCPCCNKTFSDLERHMEAQHRDFVANEVTPEGTTVQ